MADEQTILAGAQDDTVNAEQNTEQNQTPPAQDEGKQPDSLIAGAGTEENRQTTPRRTTKRLTRMAKPKENRKKKQRTKKAMRAKNPNRRHLRNMQTSRFRRV